MGFEVYQGEDRLLNLTLTDEAGNTIDLTDKTVNFLVVNVLGLTDTEVIDKDATNRKGDGTCDVQLINNDTDISPGLYWFEVWVEYNSGTKYVAEVGEFFVRKRGEPGV